MKLNPRALAVTFAVLWGGCFFLTALINRVWWGYGGDFLALMSSLYPGFHPGGMKAGIIGTLYAVLDGGVCGFLIAWLYNRVAARTASPA